MDSVSCGWCAGRCLEDQSRRAIQLIALKLTQHRQTAKGVAIWIDHSHDDRPVVKMGQ